MSQDIGDRFWPEMRGMSQAHLVLPALPGVDQWLIPDTKFPPLTLSPSSITS